MADAESALAIREVNMRDQLRLALVAGTCVMAGVAARSARAGDPVVNEAADGWSELIGSDACALAARELAASERGLSIDLPLTPASAPAPFSACFDPANPPSAEMMARVNEYMMQGWLAEAAANGNWGDRYQGTSRWSGAGMGATGDPINLTWSLVPDGLIISGAIGEPASASVLFAKWDSKTTRAAWLSLFQQCFDRWQALIGVNYTRVTAFGVDWDDGSPWGSTNGAQRGHVRISMHSIDGLSNVLAYNQFPNNGDMVLDADDAVGSSNFFSSTSNFRFFRNTVMHEHGHGIGMSHVCSTNSNQLLEPFLSTAFDGPQQDEMRGGQRRYGDNNEPDNTTATAVLAGNLSVGVTLQLGDVPASNGLTPANSSLLSIDANGEVDFHRVNATAIQLANFTLTPIGSTYDDSPQNADGSCASGNSRNALTQADLAFDVMDAAGTLLLTASVQPTGTAESLTGVLLSPPGNFFMRVYEIDAPTQSQLYKATISGTTTPTMAATDGTFTDKVRVTYTNVPGATAYQVLRNTVNNLGTASIVGSSATTTFDDTTAVPLQSYFYWVQAAQGTATFRDLAGPDTGFRDAIPTPPGPFNLSTPANGATGVSSTPTLTWSAASNVNTYTLVIDDTSDLSSPLSTVTGLVTTSYNVPGGVLADCGTYYWGVTAINANGPTASTPAVFSFLTVIPADFNGDGFVTGEDFDAFVAAFELGDLVADFDGDGFVTGEDFDAYVVRFEAGC